MRKLLFTSILSFLFASLISQVWCPPGATWMYNIDQMYMPYEKGYVALAYNGTVNIDGKVCQEISGNKVGVYGFFGELPLSGGLSVYTYVNNRVVFIRNNKGAFDTLVNFNAAIGDNWYTYDNWDSLACSQWQVPRDKWVVTDTGRTTINGYNLKRITVSVSTSPSFTLNIFERIGCNYGFFAMLNSCLLDEQGVGQFTCYWDSAFPVYTIPWSGKPCNPVGVSETTMGPAPKVSPNPVTGKFSIQLPVNSRLEIHNALGAIVAGYEFEQAGLREIDISHFSEGIYFATVRSGAAVSTVKIVKQ